MKDFGMSYFRNLYANLAAARRIQKEKDYLTTYFRNQTLWPIVSEDTCNWTEKISDS